MAISRMAIVVVAIITLFGCEPPPNQKPDRITINRDGIYAISKSIRLGIPAGTYVRSDAKTCRWSIESKSGRVRSGSVDAGGGSSRAGRCAGCGAPSGEVLARRRSRARASRPCRRTTR